MSLSGVAAADIARWRGWDQCVSVLARERNILRAIRDRVARGKTVERGVADHDFSFAVDGCAGAITWWN